MPPSRSVNALWASWLQEAANHATANGGREADSYKSAATALRNHPILLVHPSEALAIKFVGQKSVGIITARLTEYCNSHGQPFPPTPPKASRKKRAAPAGSPSSRAKRTKGSSGGGRKSGVGLTAEERALDDPTTSDEEDPTAGLSFLIPRNRPPNKSFGGSAPNVEPPRTQGPSTKIQARAKKEYVPQYRTGGWGIMIALYCAHDGLYANPDRTKEQIIERAQEYCNSSYTETGARGGGAGSSGNYTAWSSMSKLIEEGLTLETSGRPKKWTLSQKGFALARALAKEEKLPQLEVDEDRLPAAPVIAHRAPAPRPSSSINAANTTPIPDRDVSAPQAAPTTQSGNRRANQTVRIESSSQSHGVPPDETDARFFFTYLDSSGCQVNSLDQADTKMDEITFNMLYKVEFWESQASHQFKRDAILDDALISPPRRPISCPATMVGWLKRSKTVPICPGLRPFTTAPIVPEMRASTSTAYDSRVPSTGQFSARNEQGEQRARAAEGRNQQNSSGLEQRLFRPSSLSPSSPEPATPIAQNQLRLPSTRLLPSTSDMQLFSQIKPEIWPAGTYDIYLLLDHRELSSRDNPTAFFELCQAEFLTLKTRKEADLKVEHCALPLGDALWIAVHKSTGQRVVLDSIVERKRLDDLCESILDDRFHEQKARLKKSGLKDRIYLVEKFNQQSNHAKFGQQIHTARVELMLLDDCHLEQTKDWKMSVKYLVTRSRILFEAHQNIELRIIPDDQIQRDTYISTLTSLRRASPQTYWVTSYKAYESLNNKSGNLTVKQIWARMISCVKGMSPEKVSLLVKRWNTPRSFWEAYKTCQEIGNSELEKQNWDWIEGSDASEFKRIGPALCKKIWELFDQTEYEIGIESEEDSSS
ncbi:hypothetical protein CROQUDRAFT_650966 [Cronartium quercuum f. sp. fusiforme G11]|uniref:Crossover junction endonuclease MUS81 n=1 Tax=Cronartium quercuum f. sp. fusiforme G11 TaxID=708437 RepID=A0A9P6NQK5_9BASI|nr:hypothetical protein CROQUDRAFT_650966 [Cronartium quercuum f. sp. fusiforme G11]